MPRYLGRNFIEDVDDSSFYVLHPIFAMILSFINGRDYMTCIKDASNYLDVSFDLVKEFVDKLIDNPDKVLIKRNVEEISMFLPNTIISIDEELLQERYSPESFDYESIDLKIGRHYTPTRITLMLNNICYTDCIYCYEDKSIKADCQIPYSRILELIHEARKLNVVSFDVIGGEFFLYSKWREVLLELRKYDYNPFLSTKMPLGEEDVKFLADLNILDIQVSFDTAIEEHLISSIKVKKGYVKKMKDFLSLLNTYNIPVLIHTVLTRFNGSVEDMKSIYDILRDFSNVRVWHVVKGESTLYPRTEYKNIEIENKAMSDISYYLNGVSKERLIPIRNVEFYAFEKNNKDAYSYLEVNKKDPNNSFFSRAYCSGLFSSLYILPSGKVTICEQLYWNNPRFIVGDVLQNSLMEIWNSEESKNLFYIKSSDIPSDSLCHDCKDFNRCRDNRQVCYREIIKKYGKDKWYYPDINCPYVGK